MSLSNFIPEVWAAGILRNLHKMQIFAQPGVCNRNYEGDVARKGDTVRISAIGPVTVSDYTKDTDINAPQALQDAQTALTIEKAKYFNFSVDDVDLVQGNPGVMDEAMYEASYALSDAQDQYIAGLYTDAANISGTDNSPKTISAATDLYPLIVALKTALDMASVPPDGRWCILPPWAEGVLLLDDRFIRSFLTGVADAALRNGIVARAAGFDILISNNVTYSGTAATGQYRIMAGHPMAITLAEQINKVEAYRPPLRFADAVKGLQLYGAKVVRPNALAVLDITRNLA